MNQVPASTAATQVRVITRDMTGKNAWDYTLLHGPYSTEEENQQYIGTPVTIFVTICFTWAIARSLASLSLFVFFRSFVRSFVFVRACVSACVCSLARSVSLSLEICWILKTDIMTVFFMYN